MRLLRTPLVRIPALIALIGATLWFAGRRLADGTASVDRAMLADNAPALALALAIFAIAPLLLGAAWIVLLENVTPPRERRTTLMLIFVYSWLVRYVPGTVPFVAGRVYLAQRAGYHARPLLLTIGVQSMLEVLIGTVIGATSLALAFGLTFGGGAYLALALAPAAGLILLHPAILMPVANRAFRAAGRDPLPDGALPSAKSILTAAGCTAFNQCLNGAAMLMLLHVVAGASLDDALLVNGALILAAVAGILVVLAPAGFGVRDGALTGLLATRFTVEAAALAAVLARGMMVAADVLLVAVAMIVDLATGSGVLGSVFRRSNAPATSRRTRVAAEVVLGERRSA